MKERNSNKEQSQNIDEECRRIHHLIAFEVQLTADLRLIWS